MWEFSCIEACWLPSEHFGKLLEKLIFLPRFHYQEMQKIQAPFNWNSTLAIIFHFNYIIVFHIFYYSPPLSHPNPLSEPSTPNPLPHIPIAPNTPTQSLVYPGYLFYFLLPGKFMHPSLCLLCHLASLGLWRIIGWLSILYT